MDVTVEIKKWDGPRHGKFWHGQGISISGASSLLRDRAVLVTDGRLKLWLSNKPKTITVNGHPVEYDPAISNDAVWSGWVSSAVCRSWTHPAPLLAPADPPDNLPEALPDVDETVETVFSLTHRHGGFGYYAAGSLPASWGEDAVMHIRGIVSTHGSAPNIRIYGAEDCLTDPVLRINGVWIVPGLVKIPMWPNYGDFLSAQLTLEEFDKIIAHDGSPLHDEPTPPRTRARVRASAAESGQVAVQGAWISAVEELNGAVNENALAEAQLRQKNGMIEYFTRRNDSRGVARYRRQVTLWEKHRAANAARLEVLADLVEDFESKLQ